MVFPDEPLPTSAPSGPIESPVQFPSTRMSFQPVLPTSLERCSFSPAAFQTRPSVRPSVHPSIRTRKRERELSPPRHTRPTTEDKDSTVNESVEKTLRLPEVHQ
ncbi:unnamed protein product [Ectocarpus sp. 8 AP-2014]